MAVAVQSLSTASVDARNRATFLASAVRRLFGPLHGDSLNANAVVAKIDYLDLGDVRLYRIDGSRSRVSWLNPSSPQRNDAFVKLHFQTSGTSLFEQDGVTIEIGPGDCLVHEWARPFVIDNPSRTTIDIVMISKEVIRRHGRALATFTPWKMSSGSVFEVVHDIFNHALAHASKFPDDTAIARIMANTITDLLCDVMPHDLAAAPVRSVSERNRARAKAYIWQNLTDQELCVADVSEAVACTSRYVHMLFASEGTTVSRYIWDLRIEMCKRDLESFGADTNSLTDIAMSWGFSSSSHFNRMFKARFGDTPSVYRASAFRRRKLKS